MSKHKLRKALRHLRRRVRALERGAASPPMPPWATTLPDPYPDRPPPFKPAVVRPWAPWPTFTSVALALLVAGRAWAQTPTPTARTCGTPDRYWVGGSGDVSDETHWSDTSGGSGGCSVPDKTLNCIFDANSAGGAATITFVNDTTDSLTCLTWSMTDLPGVFSLDFSGVAGGYAAAIWGDLNLGGNVTNLDVNSGSVLFAAESGSHTVRSDGAEFHEYDFGSRGGSGSSDGAAWVLQDAIAFDTSSNSGVVLGWGTLDTNNQPITMEFYSQESPDASYPQHLLLGSSPVAVESFALVTGASSTASLAASTITIDSSIGTGGGAQLSVKSPTVTQLGTVTLTNAAFSIAVKITHETIGTAEVDVANLTIDPGVTVNFSAVGSSRILQVAALSALGTGPAPITLTSTTTQHLNCIGGPCTGANLLIDHNVCDSNNCYANPGTDNGNNSGWCFNTDLSACVGDTNVGAACCPDFSFPGDGCGFCTAPPEVVGFTCIINSSCDVSGGDGVCSGTCSSSAPIFTFTPTPTITPTITPTPTPTETPTPHGTPFTFCLSATPADAQSVVWPAPTYCGTVTPTVVAGTLDIQRSFDGDATYTFSQGFVRMDTSALAGLSVTFARLRGTCTTDTADDVGDVPSADFFRWTPPDPVDESSCHNSDTVDNCGSMVGANGLLCSNGVGAFDDVIDTPSCIGEQPGGYTSFGFVMGCQGQAGNTGYCSGTEDPPSGVNHTVVTADNTLCLDVWAVAASTSTPTPTPTPGPGCLILAGDPACATFGNPTCVDAVNGEGLPIDQSGCDLLNEIILAGTPTPTPGGSDAWKCCLGLGGDAACPGHDPLSVCAPAATATPTPTPTPTLGGPGCCIHPDGNQCTLTNDTSSCASFTPGYTPVPMQNHQCANGGVGPFICWNSATPLPTIAAKDCCESDTACESTPEQSRTNCFVPPDTLVVDSVCNEDTHRCERTPTPTVTPTITLTPTITPTFTPCTGPCPYRVHQPFWVPRGTGRGHPTQ